MEASSTSTSSSILNLRTSIRPHHHHHHHHFPFSFSFSFFRPKSLSLALPTTTTTTTTSRRNITSLSLRTQTQPPTETQRQPRSSSSTLPRTDKSGRFCSPRAARELALSIVYAACLEGSDPVRLYEKRINARREPGYEFDKASLLQYNHMSFGGPPVTVHTVEEENELVSNDNKQSDIEAEVLAAPPKLVYSKLILRLTKKLLVAVTDQWDSHVLVIEKVAPPNWKNEPAGRILEFCILRLAMSEIAVLGTRHQIVINEAVDLAKRFCDGAAPRVINGCLRTFVKDIEETGLPLPWELEDKQKVVSSVD